MVVATVNRPTFRPAGQVPPHKLYRYITALTRVFAPTGFLLLCAAIFLLCLPSAFYFTTPTNSGNSTADIDVDVLIKNLTKIKRKPALPPRRSTLPESGYKFFANSSSPPSTPATLLRPRLSPPHSCEMDEKGDDVLLKLASRVDPNPKPARKLAFLFLTTTPLPFAPLWELFFNDTPKNLFNIYVHADPGLNFTPPFQGVFAHRVIPSKHTCRNSPTLTSAARRLLAHALLDDEANYMFALLSPSCIPLHSFNFTYRILTGSGKSFIEILKNEEGATGRWAARGEHVMEPEVKLEDFRIGSQFWAIKRKHARIIVRDRRLWSKFKLPCVSLDTCYPEENYFPTLLSMVDPRGCIPCTLTSVTWAPKNNGHPRTYKAQEVGPELIKSLRKKRPRYGDFGTNGSDSSAIKRHDPLLFARKFTPDSLQPLMKIASDVIFKD